jgi:SAM-dependent methyltransferase
VTARQVLATLRARLAVPPDPFRFPVRLEKRVAGLCDGPGGPILNLGSGRTRLGPRVVNLDLFDFDGVQVRGDAARLPFRDGAFEGALLRGVLEHVRSAEPVLAEAGRVLVPGGFLYVEVPFLQPYHASPADYRRYTLGGLRALLEEPYDHVESGVQLGPGATLAWTLRETSASVLSFGSERAYRRWLALAGWATFWLRSLDGITVDAPHVANAASACYYLGRKRA